MSDKHNSKKSSEITRAEIAKKALPGETWEMTTYRLKDEQNQDTGTGAQILGEKQFELPLWPEDDRAAPSAIVRSSLFGLVKRGTRRTMTRKLIATWKGDEIIYTEQQLDQSDLDVWMQLIHMATRQGITDEPVKFVENQMLNDLGRSNGKSQYEWLRNSLSRLGTSRVEIKKIVGPFGFEGTLLGDLKRNYDTGETEIQLNLKLFSLFDPDFTRILLENRKNISTQLAKWLHCYISSHAVGKPHRLGVGRLRDLAGSTGNIRDFRKLLRRDMKTLQECEIVESWRITEGDSLEFIRPKRKHVEET